MAPGFRPDDNLDVAVERCQKAQQALVYQLNVGPGCARWFPRFVLPSGSASLYARPSPRRHNTKPPGMSTMVIYSGRART
jgi:hypothetical protein